MQPGARIRFRATDEIGVVIAGPDASGLLDVEFPNGRRSVHAEEVATAPSSPADFLVDDLLGPARPYALRLQARYLQYAYRYDPASGLSNARVEPKLHQVYVAHRVTQKLQPRMILADEVGLGKTIEAGLIIKELRARGLAPRVLIVAPAGLTPQWQQEMRSKFNEEFEIYDRSAVKFLGKGGVNPWTRRDNVIVSLPFASNPKNSDEIIEADWDLVVFDEAHRVRRWMVGPNKTKTTQAYRLADELKDLVDGLLLLSATPMQLHQFELYSLIELVEPGLYPTFQGYERQRKRLPELNDLMRDLKSWDTLDLDEKRAAIDKHARLLGDVAPVDAETLDDVPARDSVMDRVAELHPLAGVLIRNRKAELGETTGRDATFIPVELDEAERSVYEDVTDYIRDEYDLAQRQKNRAVGFLMVTYQKMLASSSQAIRSSFQKRTVKLRKQRKSIIEKAPKDISAQKLDELREESERTEDPTADLDNALVDPERLDWEIEHLEQLIERLGSLDDSKAHALLDLVEEISRDHPNEKILIFTQFTETQRFLVENLKAIGVPAASFNGSMSRDQKEAAVASFRDSTRVLVSTEAGGEGRNFQFCHFMVNYDLPWNPMKVEQRIGRLDRIGQTSRVFIYNLACIDTIEERILEVLAERILLFQESVGSLDPILGTVEQELEQLVMQQRSKFEDEFSRYEEDLERKVREARDRERVLADFALDRASLRRDIASRLLGDDRLADAGDLQQFVTDLLAEYGGNVSEHVDGGVVVSLAPRLVPKVKALRAVTHGVFDPEGAREYEELDFLAFGHELVDRLVDLPLSSEPVFAAARRLPDGPTNPAVELLWLIETAGLQPTGRMIRHVVDSSLSVEMQEVRGLPPLGEQAVLPIPAWAGGAIAASREAVSEAFSEERANAQRAAKDLRADQVARADRIHDYRSVRFQRRIEEQAVWIAEKEAHGSERDKRILPARKGKLAKEVQRLQRLEAEHGELLATINAQEPGTSLELVAAGLVIGT